MTSLTNAVTGLVKGKVQGVCFRAEAQKKARNFALTGWVRNTDDGNVEVLIAGNNPEPPDRPLFRLTCRH